MEKVATGSGSCSAAKAPLARRSSRADDASEGGKGPKAPKDPSASRTNATAKRLIERLLEKVLQVVPQRAQRRDGNQRRGVRAERARSERDEHTATSRPRLHLLRRPPALRTHDQIDRIG